MFSRSSISFSCGCWILDDIGMSQYPGGVWGRNHCPKTIEFCNPGGWLLFFAWGVVECGGLITFFPLRVRTLLMLLCWRFHVTFETLLMLRSWFCQVIFQTLLMLRSCFFKELLTRSWCYALGFFNQFLRRSWCYDLDFFTRSHISNLFVVTGNELKWLRWRRKHNFVRAQTSDIKKGNCTPRTHDKQNSNHSVITCLWSSPRYQKHCKYHVSQSWWICKIATTNYTFSSRRGGFFICLDFVSRHSHAQVTATHCNLNENSHNVV